MHAIIDRDGNSAPCGGPGDCPRCNAVRWAAIHCDPKARLCSACTTGTCAACVIAAGASLPIRAED